MIETSQTSFAGTLLHSVMLFLQHEPELALFLSIGIGFYIGARKFGPVQLGGVCGTLIVALLLGQSGVVVAPVVKNVFFAFFIFALGYAGGPQFFASLNAKGLRLGLFSIIEVITVLSLALGAMHLFNFDPGTTAGLVAGAATESAVIGTASEAISRLPLAPDVVNALQAKVATAYSLTYIFGLITIVVFTSQIAPLLLRVSLRDEAEKLWDKLGGNKSDAPEAGTPDSSAQGVPEMTGRIYAVTVAEGKTVAEADSFLSPEARIERVSRRGRQLGLHGGLRLKKDDLILVVGRRARVIQAAGLLGEERTSNPALNMEVDTEEYIVTAKKSAPPTLAAFRAMLTELDPDTHAHVVSILRDGRSMPLLPDLELEPGDNVRLYGPPRAVIQAGDLLGKRVSKSDRTNIFYIGAGIVLGILVGRITIPLGSIDLSLGTGGGALLTGLLFGWFQSRHPSIPGTSAASLELMKDLGLAAFVACIGLSSGKQAFALVSQYGVVLPLVGVSIALTPAIVSLLVGRFLFKLEIPVLLGGIAGQQCSTPALSAVQAAAGNTTPLIGYTITYAVSNVLLPLLGPIIVSLASM